MKLLVAGCPSTSRKPLRLPMDLRWARMSMRVDLPAPEGPSRAWGGREGDREGGWKTEVVWVFLVCGVYVCMCVCVFLKRR